MARNASGTYSRVVDDYVDGGVIRADDHNDEHDDFGAEITDSLNRSGKGGMLAGLKLINGQVGAPAFYFAGATTTGMYLNAAGDLRCAVAAADLQRWTAALVRIETALLVNGNVECNAMDASGSATVGGTLDVTGAITGASLDVSGEAECGTLDCLGNGAVAGALTASSTAAIAGNTTIGAVTAAWAQNTAYVIGNQVIANGNVYVCDTNGTSAGSGTGPSGTTANIVDGTTQWDFVTPVAPLGVAGNIRLSGTDPASTAAFVDTITPKNIVKAWARITTDGAGNATLVNGFNISTVAINGTDVRVTLANSMANVNYCAIVNGETVELASAFIQAANIVDIDAGAVDLSAVARTYNLIVVGDQ